MARFRNQSDEALVVTIPSTGRNVPVDPSGVIEVPDSDVASFTGPGQDELWQEVAESKKKDVK